MVRHPAVPAAAGALLVLLLFSHTDASAKRLGRRPAGARFQAAARHRTAPRKPRRKRKVVKWVTATAYCLGPCRRCETRGRTYTGTRGRRGIAVARSHRRRVVPLGARLRVPGYGAARVDDVGGKVGRTQIDLRFRSHRLASRWGKRKLKVVALLH